MVPVLQLAVAAAIILATNDAVATEDIEVSKDFRISRDFRAFNIKSSSKIFFDTTKFVIYSQSSITKDKQLEAEARKTLDHAVKLVSTKAESDYFVEIRMAEALNYAVRNVDREPSTGFVIVSICSYPISEMEHDCQSLTFYFFRTYPRNVILSRVLSMWLERLVIR